MLKKIFLTSVIFFVSLTALSAERASAYYDNSNIDMLKMPYSTLAPFLNLEPGNVAEGVTVAKAGNPPRDYTSAGLYTRPSTGGVGASVLNYYPVKFYEEYFYRDNSKEPIRDYRYYNVKTFVPDRNASNKNPIRDFRVEMWKNKQYK